MTTNDFQKYIEKYAREIRDIKEQAHALHASVNQTYDDVHPYAFHLDMVADNVNKYGHCVCACEQDVLPMFFGAYYHDSIEDARLTYNDVKNTALRYMNEEQAVLAAEIVYALTNDKGRTREERAGDKYYQGIRETPYAPFVKLADRLANITYSFKNYNDDNVHMAQVYRQELPHFLDAIDAHNDDVRFHLPETMLEEINKLVHSVNQEKI
jgi:(p)ppGpp synthase/HD superfamily hydrolase